MTAYILYSSTSKDIIMTQTYPGSPSGKFEKLVCKEGYEVIGQVSGYNVSIGNLSLNKLLKQIKY